MCMYSRFIYASDFRDHERTVNPQFSSLCCSALVLLYMLFSETSEAQIGLNVFPSSKPSYPDRLINFPDYSFSPFQDYEVRETLEAALSLNDAGNHFQALMLLQKAFMSNRVQHGFYNETQITLQKALIEVAKGQRDWKTVDDFYAHLELLYRRIYDRNPQKLEDGLKEISEWLSYSLYALRLGKRHQKLHRTYRILKQRLEIVEKQLSPDNFKILYLSEKISILERELYPNESEKYSDSDGKLWSVK